MQKQPKSNTHKHCYEHSLPHSKHHLCFPSWGLSFPSMVVRAGTFTFLGPFLKMGHVLGFFAPSNLTPCQLVLDLLPGRCWLGFSLNFSRYFHLQHVLRWRSRASRLFLTCLSLAWLLLATGGSCTKAHTHPLEPRLCSLGSGNSNTWLLLWDLKAGLNKCLI